MKRAVILAATLFFVSAGLVQACELCEKLERLGYTKSQIAQVIRTSANRAEAEQRLQRLIEKNPNEAMSKQKLVDEKKPEPSPPPPERPVVIVEAPKPTPKASSPPVEQIMEASLADAAVLLSPTEQILSKQKADAAKADQLVKRAELKEKAKKQKLMDAGVTTSAIGTAFIPGVGPFIAGGIIIGRTIYGLFQDDLDE